MDTIKSMVKVRMSNKDAHYGGGLVDGAHILQIMGDAATELSIKLDGDEGLFLRYDEVQFLAPVYAGDYIEVRGEITEIGNTSRRMELIAKKVIIPRPDLAPSAADFLEEPIIVATAKAIGITKKELQRK